MRAATVTQQKSTTSTAQASAAGARDDKKVQLRGLSYDEGVQMLTPRDGSTANADTPKPGKKGLPVEIEALGLKHVKVTCTPEAWAGLSAEEKDGVITFLTMKEEECKTSDKIKGSKVDIDMGRKVRTVDELATQEQKAADNQALLQQGQVPMQDKTIGVDEGEPKVTRTETQTVTEVPIKQPQEMQDHFDAKGSTFDSADYKPEDMQQSGVMELLEQAAAKILEYLALDPTAHITMTVVASESHVTNPEQFKVPGSLAAARAANGVALAQAHFAARGIPLAQVGIMTQNLGANGPAWDPQAGISKHDPMYTEHQFVRLEICADVMVESDATEEVVETEVEESKTYDGETIKMMVDDKERRQRDPGGSSTMGVTKNQKGPKHGKKQRSNKKWKTMPCPWK